jgi:hypothetical protein
MSRCWYKEWELIVDLVKGQVQACFGAENLLSSKRSRSVKGSMTSFLSIDPNSRECSSRYLLVKDTKM